MADKLRMASADIVDENIEFIASRWPNAVMEVEIDGKLSRRVDFDVLKQELSKELISDKQDRYVMTWPDKKDTVLFANSPCNSSYRPLLGKSNDFETTNNVYIEGDNLDSLKVLRETYLGKVKMIYIDPPYNTGNDFIYKDDFSESKEEFQAKDGSFDENKNCLVANPDSFGRFHTNWLNMMYSRLRLAKDVLSEDGAIFISLDDHELSNLLKCCDEIFGETNKVGLFTIMSNPRGSQNSKFLSYVHEYILMYARNISCLELSGIEKDESSLNEFSEIDAQGRKYRLLGLRKRGGAWRKEDRPNMFYPIYVDPSNGNCSLTRTSDYSIEVIPQRPDGELSRWTWGIDKFQSSKNILIGKKINRASEGITYDIFRMDFIDNENGEDKKTRVKTIWTEKDVNYQNAKNEIKELFGNSEIFDYPKPTFIVRRLLELMDLEDGDIVMDFFSGSATTAQAVMQYNFDKNAKIKFLLIQLPEALSQNSQGFKSGFRTICDIGEERIRRAGKKIQESAGLMGDNLDIGFRVFKLDSSNMKDVYYNPSLASQSLLEQEVDNFKDDRTPLDLLFQVMLEMGIELSAHIDEKEVKGKKFYAVNDSDLVACFDEDINDDIVKAIAEIKPIYAVFRDSSFKNDSSNINCEQLFKVISPATEIKVI